MHHLIIIWSGLPIWQRLMRHCPKPAQQQYVACQDAYNAYSARSRTRFHADGGQHSAVMADSIPHDRGQRSALMADTIPR
jgi:hypothetical protein